MKSGEAALYFMQQNHASLYLHFAAQELDSD